MFNSMSDLDKFKYIIMISKDYDLNIVCISLGRGGVTGGLISIMKEIY